MTLQREHAVARQERRKNGVLKCRQERNEERESEEATWPSPPR
jgi:hypothetical protein